MNFEAVPSSAHLQALRRSLLANYQEEDLHQLRVTIRRIRSALRCRKEARRGNYAANWAPSPAPPTMPATGIPWS